GHTETWKRKVVGGEMVPHAAKSWLGKQWGHTREMTRRSHFSWVGPYGPALESKTSKAFVERSDEMVRKMGYQFRLEEIRHSTRVLAGAPCKIFLKGVNEGVAPFYYPWPVQLAWIDADGKILSKTNLNDDIRKWLPGHFSINTDMPAPSKAGDYRIGFGIEDPWQGKPTVRLANRLPISGDWTVLGQVEVRKRSK
ncbi:MAG: DUF4832 domain-containing protein, partial [Verrucomicrobiota bacterium]|nr:DUF4832 domain-containing protein [Verrucomicrobiota bacterium]